MKILAALALLFLAGCSSLRPAPLVSKEIVNPLIAGDHPDPFLFRWPANGSYFLSHTRANGIPILKSQDLVSWTESQYAFTGPPTPANKPWRLNQFGFCHVWAPEFFPAGGNRIIATFSAVGYEAPHIPDECPPFDGDTSIYALTSMNGMEGPFGKSEAEPILLGKSPACDNFPAYPHSPGRVKGCFPGKCASQFRIDGSYFAENGKTFFAYVWFTNPAVKKGAEKKHRGFNIGIAEMDPQSPTRTLCQPAAHSWHVVSPGDKNLLKQLADSCSTCGERLSFSKDTDGREWIWQGMPAGIVEGPSLFRRGEYVYLLFSHAVYDSAYYGVAWIAAKTVEGLANPAERIVGRYLIPSGNYSFGHGTPFLGPDGKNYFYVYHRTDNDACLKNVGRKCDRDIFVSPLEFDGVRIKPRRPDHFSFN